jgi:hypothetical protein
MSDHVCVLQWGHGAMPVSSPSRLMRRVQGVDPFRWGCCGARRFLHHHVDEVGGLGERTVGELGLASDAVVLVPESMPAIHAFAAMQQSGVSGAGIVGLDGTEPHLTSISYVLDAHQHMYVICTGKCMCVSK